MRAGLAYAVVATELGKVAKPFGAPVSVNVLEHTSMVLNVVLERVNGLASFLAAAAEHADIAGTC